MRRHCPVYRGRRSLPQPTTKHLRGPTPSPQGEEIPGREDHMQLIAFVRAESDHR